MADFKFVGAAYQAPSITQGDQECINWYPEVDKQEDGRHVIALYPTPGLLSQVQAPPIAEVRGMHTITGGNYFFSAVGNDLFVFDRGYNSTFVGNLNTSSGQVSIKDNGVSVYLCDGPYRYTCSLAGTGFAVITDGAFNGANKIEIVDNFLIYNNPVSNQWGATNALSTVSSGLSFASKLTAPDNIVSIIANLREVSLLGERTSEVWVDAGLFPFPFQIIPGTSMQHGCAATHSVARLGESMAWLSKDDRGQAVVVMTVGYQPKRISTHAVETDIGTGVVSDAIAFSYQQGGHEFYVLTLPTQDKTWCYDLATDLWHKRAYRDTNNVLHRHRANCSTVFQGKVLVGDYQNGMIYSLERNVYTDNGVAIQRVRRCRHLVTDLNRQYFHELRLQFQPGQGLSTGQGSNPQAMLHWSDDGGNTFSNEHWRPVGKMGIYKNLVRWLQLGQSRDRIFEVIVTDPFNAVIVSGDLHATEGGH